MPATVAHYYFAKLVLEKSSIRTKLIGDVARLASQGADPFFFYGQLFKFYKNAKSVAQLGERLHQDTPLFLIKNLIEEGGQVELSFAYGYGLHYILDRVMHPYIFYCSGFEGDDYTGIYKINHALFESHLDRYFFDKLNNKIRPYQMLKVSSNDLKIIDCFFKKNYGNIGKYRRSVREYYLISKLVDDASGKRRQKRVKKGKLHTNVSALMMPSRCDEDILNNQKRDWHYPTGEDSSNQSIDELFLKALEMAMVWDNIFVDILNKNFDQKVLEQFFANTNFCGRELEKQFKLKKEKLWEAS